MYVVDNAGEENAQCTAVHRRPPPLLYSQAYKKVCFKTRQETLPTGQLGIDKMLLPSTSAQVPEGCCEDCAQKMPQLSKEPTQVSSICCHRSTDCDTSWGYRQCLARIAELRTLQKGPG